MNSAKLAIVVAFALILGIPFIVRPESAAAPDGARTLVIVSPHNEQIRTEFEAAFDRWHREHHGEPVDIVWQTPGGTSQIVKHLVSIYAQAIENGRIRTDGERAEGADPMPYDLMFGGGSYTFNVQLKGDGVEAEIGLPDDISDEQARALEHKRPDVETVLVIDEDKAGKAKRKLAVSMTLSVPADLSAAELETLYGENRVGHERNTLYDPDRHWFGTALSAFGMVYNRDVLDELGLDEPTTWEDLTDPRLVGNIALASAGHSGSVTTTYDAILNDYGWYRGWVILRGMSANARSFAHSSSKIPIDVSQGEAAVGLAIDFYGRSQAQAVLAPGETPETGRLGYITPPGLTFVDPDPIALLRAGPDPELATRFIRFTLTEQAQALWQFHAESQVPSRAPAGELGADADTLIGPAQHELRRMPVRRVMYDRYRDEFVDNDIRPFKDASDSTSKRWRSAIEPIMKAACIDTHDELKQAFLALHEFRERAAAARAEGEPEDRAFELAKAAYYAFPMHEVVWPEEGVTFLIGLSGELFRSSRSPRGPMPVSMPGRFIDVLPPVIRFTITHNGITAIELGDAGDLAFKAHNPPSRHRRTVWTSELPDGLTLLNPESGEMVDAHELAGTIGIRDDLWDALTDVQRAELQIHYTAFFRGQYRRVIEIAREAGVID